MVPGPRPALLLLFLLQVRYSPDLYPRRTLLPSSPRTHPLRVSDFSLSLKEKSKGKRQRNDPRGFPQLSVGSRQELTAGRLAAGAGGSSPGPPPSQDAPSATSFPLAVGGGDCAGGVMDGDSTSGELHSSHSFIDFLKKPLLSPQPPTCKAEDFPPCIACFGTGATVNFAALHKMQMLCQKQYSFSP